MKIPRIFYVITALAVVCSPVWLLGCDQKPASTDDDSSDGLTSVPPAPSPVPRNATQSPTSPVPAAPVQSGQDLSTDVASKPSIPETTQDYLAEIETKNDFVKLAALKKEYESRTEKSEIVEKAFEGKWKSLTAMMVPRTLIDGLDLLAVDTRATGPREYTFSFLLHTTADIVDFYHLTVTGKVNPKHAQNIKSPTPGANYMSWPLLLYDDPTTKWKSGEYHVVQLLVESEIIPYDLSVNLQTRGVNGQWTGDVGNLIELGWQTDTSSIPEFMRLHALHEEFKKAGVQSTSADEAFSSNWDALTADMEPKNLIEGLDLLAVDTRITGDKEYTFAFLLHTTANLDTNYHLAVTGNVDASHVQHIKPDKPGGAYTTWVLSLNNDPTSDWEAGEYHVVQLPVQTEIIPYNLRVNLQTRDEKGNWTGNPGNFVNLGWQAATQE